MYSLLFSRVQNSEIWHVLVVQPCICSAVHAMSCTASALFCTTCTDCSTCITYYISRHFHFTENDGERIRPTTSPQRALQDTDIGPRCSWKDHHSLCTKGRQSSDSYIPTIGLNVETLNASRNKVFTAMDIGGRSSFRPAFARHYYGNTNGIIFVIDSADHDRLDQAIKELQITLNHEMMSGKPTLIFANKQDLPGAKSSEEISDEIAEAIGKSNPQTPWRCIGCSAYDGAGLQGGFKWVHDFIDGKIKLDDPALDNDAHTTSTSDISSDISTEEYDPEENATLDHFSPIKQGTSCPFAKSSTLWGSPDADSGSSVEDQAKKITPTLAEFVRKTNEGENIDGYCIELTSPAARRGGPTELGECVRKMLSALSDLDPANEQMMRVNFIGARGWRFRFAGADFFVTTFAPCYPPSSSRYSFGSPHAFLLLQPESSFARHKLPADTPETNWQAPRTIRDKARVAYKDAGRPYHIPDTIEYPPAEHIVKPINDDGKSVSVVRWWDKPLRT